MPAKITKKSPFTGRQYTMEFSVYEQDEFELRYLAYMRGEKLIQEAFAELSDAAREFIKTGITPSEWDLYIGEEE